MSSTSGITITLGDQAENHKGMQIIGELADRGFTLEDLHRCVDKCQERGIETELFNLGRENAFVLVMRNAVDHICGEGTSLFQELAELDWDSKALMYGRVVNKHARHNLCFDEEDQEPDYANGKGRVVSWRKVPMLRNLIASLDEFIPTHDLVAEGNYYYDLRKTGIGFHGDSERKKVVGVRLGASYPIVFQWYYQSEPVGNPTCIDLNHGDMYIMTEKTTGNDWKRKNIHTLRHAAGCKKYITIPVKKEAGEKKPKSTKVNTAVATETTP